MKRRAPALAGGSFRVATLTAAVAGAGAILLSGAAAPARALGPAGRSVRVPILMYHRVTSPSWARSAESRDLTVAPRAFRQQLAWLHRNGYHPIHMARLYRAMRGDATLPRRPVVITVDDGYTDGVKQIAPALRRYRWPATFFVIAGRMHVGGFLHAGQIAHLDRIGMDIGSHTVHHVRLAALGPRARRAELVRSRRALERIVGHPVRWFAYPFGSFDPATERAVHAAGYLLAFTTQPGSTISAATPFAEPRIEVHGAQTLADFAAQMRAAS